jgi:hypothetical protein
MTREDLVDGTVYYYTKAVTNGFFIAGNLRLPKQPELLYNSEYSPSYKSLVTVLWTPRDANDASVPPEWGEVAP